MSSDTRRQLGAIRADRAKRKCSAGTEIHPLQRAINMDSDKAIQDADDIVHIHDTLGPRVVGVSVQ